MDELWIILLGIAFSIFSGVKDSRKKKAARRAAAEAEAEVMKDIRESREKAAREAENRRKMPKPDVFEPVVIHSEESRRPEMDGKASAVRRLTEAEDAMRHIASRNATQKHKETKAAKTADSTNDDNIADDFDLRRAVIYSEILKPKFDDVI